MKLKSFISPILTLLGFDQTENGQDLNLNISKGFQLDNPKIFVPWGIDEKTLTDLFQGHNLNHITAGYYTTSCSSLNKLTCMLGFHFEPNKNGQLNELEFFRTDYSDQQKSFDDFQTHFVNAFGQPSSTTKGNEGFYNYEWRLNDIHILHYVFDRFGPEEHMRMRKLK